MDFRSIVAPGSAILLAALILVGCAPAVAPAPAEPAVPTPTLAQPLAVPTESPTTQLSTEAPVPVATSRGPGLHATNPANVNLASGELQLVEFFRFT